MIPETLISRFNRFLLRRICRGLVKQAHLHKRRITAYYRIMREAARAEFTEDNDPTLDAFLRECFEDAITECRETDGGHPRPPKQQRGDSP